MGVGDDPSVGAHGAFLEPDLGHVLARLADLQQLGQATQHLALASLARGPGIAVGVLLLAHVTGGQLLHLVGSAPYQALALLGRQGQQVELVFAATGVQGDGDH
ncbi:hypothetical protein D3C79_917600 [compost metagenome]